MKLLQQELEQRGPIAAAAKQAPRPPFLVRYKWPLLVALMFVVVAAAAAMRWTVGPKVQVGTVLRKDFVQTVVASGHVEAPHRVDIGAQITGTVARVPVAEGQVVRAGEVLIELEAAELHAAERQAVVAVTQAQARVRQLREVQGPVAEQAVRTARANLENARSQQLRSEELFQKGFIGAAAVEDARRTVELADAQLRTAQKQLDTAGASGSDFALAQAAVAQAEASLEAARARARYAVIAAVADGTLIARDVEAGDVVQPGKVLMTLSPAGRVQLVVDIDEKNLRLLALGQKAVASADAYPQQRFAAELAYINPGVNAQTGAVEIKLDVPSPPPYLKQDMTVSVDIEVARRAQALLVPVDAVHDATGASPWVQRVENNRATRRDVRLGLSAAGFSEVLDGLREGDAVLPSSAGVNDGARVRATPAGRAQ
jgi:HlyD family secretion protein